MREPIEPDDVFEKVEWTTGRRLRRAADTVTRTATTAGRTAVHVAEAAARSARTGARRAAAPGGAVDRTEERLTDLLTAAGERVPGRGERTDRVFATARAGVSVGARRARRLLRS
ncbi:hypothetical protein GCM10009823_33650 [Brevibacterium salitolerans]|uniref:Uncharacterized protein n=2 Tax=Brevibacteriaceae TaxID=85019 RepID=A0ABP5IV21_9MICO